MVNSSPCLRTPVGVGQRNPAYEPSVNAYPGSGCTTPSPWSITITDSASMSLVVGGLHVDALLHVLRTGSGCRSFIQSDHVGGGQRLSEDY